MTPGYAKIVVCPFCGTKKELMTLNSANSIGAQYWSDTKIISPMHPTVSPVQKCPNCGKYYLEYKQETKNTNGYSNEDGKLSFWEWKEAYKQFSTTDNDIKKGWKHLFQKKKRPLFLDEEDWVNVHGWLLQSYNDCFYRCPVVKEPPLEEFNFIVGVIKKLIETIEWGDISIPLFPSGVRFRSPEEEEVWTSVKNPLWKAELYREAKEFEKCAELLRSIEYNCLDEFQKRLYDGIKANISVKVFNIFKENQTNSKYSNKYRELIPSKTIYKISTKRCIKCGWSNDNNATKCLKCTTPLDKNNVFKVCSQGHYYKDDYCPYCTTKRKIHVKVCPQKHGYDEKEPVCPFCGDEKVISTLEVSVNHTFCISNLFYEKEGLTMKISKASVDDATISGKICLEVYHTLVYKYKYLIVDGKGNWLIVFPNSNVTLIGEDFSDSFLGREFVKMCDELFEKANNK